MELDVPLAIPAVQPEPAREGPAPDDAGFGRVLVPLDGSTLAEVVLPFVRRLGSLRGTTVVVLQVVPPTPVVAMEVPAPAIVEADESAREEAERYVQTVAGRLRAQGLDAEPHTKLGDPARVILDAVRELRVELIAMTTHGRTGLGRLLFGSVAEQVLRRSPVPVFLVRVSEEEEARQAA